MEYTLHPECIICSVVSEETRKQIDAKILLDVPSGDIQKEFCREFPASSPLTIDAIEHHKNHLYRSIALKKLDELGIQKASIKITNTLNREELMRTTYDSVMQGQIDEMQILNALIADAYMDTVQLSRGISANSSNYNFVRLGILTKDTVRKNMADIIQRQTELRQKQGDADLERHTFARAILKEVIDTLIELLRDDMHKSQEEINEFGNFMRRRFQQSSLLQKYL